MDRSKISSVGVEAMRRAWRFYHSNAPYSTLLMRLKFRDLRRELYDGIWRDAARNIGAEVEKWHGQYHKISRGNRSTVVYLTQVPLNNALWDRLLIDKKITQELLRERGYPVPENLVFSSDQFDMARDFFERNGEHVVIKPASGTAGGKGVTTDIKDIDTLRRAATSAGRMSPKVMIEQHVTGSSYRLLYLDGELIDTVRRDPPAVVGDGNSTIRALMKKESKRRLAERPVSALLPLRIDSDCLATLKGKGLSLESRPAAGETVLVKQAINDNAAAQNHNVRGSVHAETARMGARIMADLGITLGGIDVQCGDISRPFAETGGMILEINSPPGLHHHYLIADPATRHPVPETVLEFILSTGQGALSARPVALAKAV